ncbi:MAG: hypothetical protein ACKN81_00695, partial [Pirellulaceae bacterium]
MAQPRSPRLGATGAAVRVDRRGYPPSREGRGNDCGSGVLQQESRVEPPALDLDSAPARVVELVVPRESLNARRTRVHRADLPSGLLHHRFPSLVSVRGCVGCLGLVRHPIENGCLLLTKGVLQRLAPASPR